MIVIAPPVTGTRESAGTDDFEAATRGTWIVRESGSGSRDAAEALLAQAGIQPRSTMEVSSNEAIVQCVASGIGFGVVPRICARDQLSLGRLRMLVSGSAPVLRQFYRMRLPHRPVSQSALAFEALLARETAVADTARPRPD
jgi:DNA-binding transcriptional LysR family regulator